MIKELHKAIMNIFRLKNKFLKTKSITDLKNCNVQRNYCNNLLRSTKNIYFNNLHIRKVNDNRPLWKRKTIARSSFFEKKIKQAKKLTTTKKIKNVSDNAELCRIFNNYFPEILANLKTPRFISNSAVDSNAVSNPLSIATKINIPVLSI